ncbi:MAG: aminoacyl-tRNA hydrolase [Fusobacterium sp.]|nr:aminoacyl-tRNA hydrolase [Fusobacterium sp.]
MKIVIGLGNPGKQYENTRHNIGFMVLDKIIKKENLDEKNKFHGIISEKNFKGEKIIFLKPQTYMNLSGNSVIEIVKFYKLNPEEDIIVIYDDMDLPFGQLRVKNKGSAGGHNGIKSIISHIGEKFIRIKCGIGNKKNDAVEHVLGKFNQSEQDILNEMIGETIKCTEEILSVQNLEQVMQIYNKKKIISC